VGRNSLLLLNVPPDSRGLIPAEDSLRLMEFRAALDSIFAHDLAKKVEFIFASKERNISECNIRPTTYDPLWLVRGDYDNYWATDDGVTTAYIQLRFDEPQTFNRVMLQEYIPLGQRVEKFHIEIEDENGNALGPVTISQGIRNSVPSDTNKLWDYMYAADNALYDVKEHKKGEVVLLHKAIISQQSLAEAQYS
jgi:alpha-L-fucosidase